MGRLGELANVLPLQGAGLRDLFDVREVLETQGAEWAAQRRSAHHVERFKGIVEDGYRHADDLDVLNERVVQFHVAIAEAARRAMLEHLTSVEQAISYSGRTKRDEAG